MRHIIFADAEKHPIALLIKYSAFNRTELLGNYVDVLNQHGIPSSDVFAITADYDEKGKTSAKFVKGYLELLMPALRDTGVKFIYCADAAYFKALTKLAHAEPHLGYAVPCKIPGYEDMTVVLGVNHKSLIYNPANEPKMALSIKTLIDVVTNNYQELGHGIIHSAAYPTQPADIAGHLEKLHQYPRLSADIEAFSLSFEKAGIGTITFCWDQHNGIAFPVDYRSLDKPENGQFGTYRPDPAVHKLLRNFFETYQGELIWHGSTYDLEVLIFNLWMKDLKDIPGMLQGLEIMTARFHDTKTIAYLATNTTAGNSLGLKDLAHPFAGNWAQSEIKDITRIPLHQLLEYNLIDGLSTNYVFDTYYPIMQRDQQEELYFSLMRPSLITIMQIEMVGMPLDPAAVARARKELEAIVEDCLKMLNNTLQPIAATELIIQTAAMTAANAKLKTKQHPLSHFADMLFNPNSGPQKQILLYQVMGLPVIDFTDTKQPATGGETLEKLINHTRDPVYKQILEALITYSQAEKVLTSFIPAFEEALDKGEDVVWLHGRFNLGGTKSGRLSSSDPNLQNIPAGSTYGKLIKSCFRAPDGYLFCGADFNSLEDYISALTTKDPNKLKVYLEGYDGHCLRAFSYFPDRLPGIVDTVESINSIKKLFPEVRQDSKAPTFALTYQGTYMTLMRNLGFEEAIAKQIEANYHQLYQVSDQWVQLRLDQAAIDGYVTIAFGLRLRTPLLKQSLRNHSKTPYEAMAEGRTAGNALGQSYGLLNNRALNAFMQKVWRSEHRFDIWPVAMIHDAIYLVIKDHIDVVHWVNQNLIDEMRWQELPEIQHDQVKIGAELSIFWPTWATELTIPNYADKATIWELASKHLQEHQPTSAAA